MYAFRTAFLNESGFNLTTALTEFHSTCPLAFKQS